VVALLHLRAQQLAEASNAPRRRGLLARASSRLRRAAWA
jgi:hypothetical protein